MWSWFVSGQNTGLSSSVLLVLTGSRSPKFWAASKTPLTMIPGIEPGTSCVQSRCAITAPQPPPFLHQASHVLLPVVAFASFYPPSSAFSTVVTDNLFSVDFKTLLVVKVFIHPGADTDMVLFCFVLLSIGNKRILMGEPFFWSSDFLGWLPLWVSHFINPGSKLHAKSAHLCPADNTDVSEWELPNTLQFWRLH